MNKKPNYVPCQSCDLWEIEDRRTRLCRDCNNSGQRIDPKEFLCNMCGEEMCHDIKTSSGRWSSDVPCGLHDAAVQGGYESYHLFDTTIYTFSFCEKCLRQLFIQCKIKPEISDMDIDTSTTREEDWARDQESYEDRVWRDAGGHHQAYLDRKCNGLKDCPNQAEYTRLYRGDFTEECRCEAHKDRYFQANVHQNTKFVPNVLKPFL